MNAYLYPNSKWKGIENPYLDNFVKSFRDKIEFINYSNTAKAGLIDIFKYIFRLDLIFFNWVEDVPSKKGGLIQWIMFKYIIYPVLKMRKVKIIWVLHNNVSHYNTNLKLKQEIFDSFFKYSDIILTHAEDGVQIINGKLGEENNKALYYPHPFNSRNRHMNQKKQIDILIWGSISRYKGIHLFMDQVNQSKYLQDLNIKICGKVMDKTYEETLIASLPNNVDFQNRFVTNEELDEYLAASKITLFIYASDSVLSSGALSDSVGYGNVIVGPAIGAFKDLNKYNLVSLFSNPDEIPDVCKKILDNFPNSEMINSPDNSFVYNHSWSDFSEFFMNSLSNSKL